MPNNYNEAIQSPESEGWRQAMKEEMSTIINRKVWDLVPKPKDVRVIGCRWVFNRKENEMHETVKYKARLVAQGFRQIKGSDYDEVFSPVVNFTVIRLFFSLLVAKYKWYHYQLDVKSAYLYAPLNETIYMFQPPGYKSSDKPQYVCKLNKALYGLHQSGREWFGEMHTKLTEMNFKRLEWTNCTYVLRSEVVLLLYVDDIVLFAKTEQLLKNVIDMLGKKFELKVMGKTRKLLGVVFEENDGLTIQQSEYIDRICERFEKFKIPIVSLPIAAGVVLSRDQCPNTEAEKKEMEAYPYRNLIGCLAFLSSRTRPDISYAVNVFSQFQSNPGIIHWNYLLKLLGYVKHTRHFKLKLSCSSNFENLKIKCYSDADFAANRDDRVSMGGLITFLNEIPISWRTTKQKCVALSTMEAEYISLTEASKELMWCIRILSEVKNLKIIDMHLKSTLLCDNKAAIDFSNSPIENNRTKHIHIRYHFLRNLLKDKFFNLEYINSKSNLADIFTKPLTKIGLKTFNDSVFIS